MTETRLRVLLVANDERDYRRVRDYLAAAEGTPFALVWTPTYAAGRAALALRAHDVALIADWLGANRGLNLLRDARTTGDTAPAIILARTVDATDDAAALAAGAVDYLALDQLDAPTLAHAIRYALSRDFSQATLDALAAHIVVLDAKATIITVNAAWHHFAEDNGFVGTGNGLGMNYLAICDAAAQSGVAGAAAIGAAIRALLAGNREPFVWEYSCHSPTEQRWFAIRASRFTGDGPPRVVIAHEDISAYHHAEAEIRFQAQLLDQVPAAVIAVDPTGAVRHWNAHATTLYGWTSAEAVGQPVAALTISYADAASEQALSTTDIAQEIATHVTEGTAWTGEFPMRRKDGSGFPAYLTNSPLRDEHGQPVGVVSVSVDISERKVTETALRDSEANLAEAQRIAQVGSWEYDHTNGQLIWSDELFRIAGYAPRSFVPTPERHLASIHPADRARVASGFQAVTITGKAVESEFRLLRPDGVVRFIRQRAESLPGATGQPARRLGAMHDVTERRALEGRLAHQATHDALTDLPNRAFFFERLGRVLTRARGGGAGGSLLYLDLDHFKDVNDTLGHVVGDQLLVAVGARLRSGLREGDTLARMGGDEFSVLLEAATDAGATEAAVRLLAALAVPLLLDGREYHLSASIGIVTGLAGYAQPEEAIRDADIALYQAKASGRADHALFDITMKAALTARLALERDLRQALERDEFILHYQPLIDLHTGRLVKVEALVRWHHPTRGLVPPDDFIPLAEETGLIVPLGRWVLAEACRQSAAWVGAGTPVAIAVNLAAREFQHPGLAAEVAAALALAKLPACWLWLEITESLAMRDVTATIATLRTLRVLGVSVAIDDFGTGYSSLAYLKRLPVDTLKIDKAFIDGLGVEEEDTAIVTAIVTLAHTLGLAVVAEGVETAAQVTQLSALGCDMAQGYHFVRPLPAGEIAVLLAQRTILGGTPSTNGTAAPTTGALRQRSATRIRRFLLPAKKGDPQPTKP